MLQSGLCIMRSKCYMPYKRMNKGARNIVGVYREGGHKKTTAQRNWSIDRSNSRDSDSSFANPFAYACYPSRRRCSLVMLSWEKARKDFPAVEKTLLFLLQSLRRRGTKRVFGRILFYVWDVGIKACASRTLSTESLIAFSTFFYFRFLFIHFIYSIYLIFFDFF